ncbi:MAG TPA: DNA polymerase III subunit beta, partial [Mycobacteriales bacterium]|nr:DNA polymerase III subunit beta [Mycobacteriales bacterium]
GGTSGDGMLGIRADGTAGRCTMARLLDANFPRLGRLWPTGYQTVAELPARALVEAIGRVCPVAGPNPPVRLSFRPGTVLVSAGEPDGAEAEEELAGEVSGEPVTVAFIPPYLLDGLRAAGPEAVRLSLTRSGKPAMITPEPGAGAAGGVRFRYLVMSLRMP